MAELVGLNAQVPDILPKLSQILQIQHQQAQLAGEQQSLRQRQNLARYDWNKHIGEDGTLDLNTLNDPGLMAAAGDQYQDVLAKAVSAKTAQLESKRTLTALRSDQREAFAEMMGALRSDKDVAEDNEKGRQKVNQAMIQYGEMYGEDVLPVLSAYAAPLQKTPKGRISDALRAIQLQAHSASQQLSAQQPSYVGTGGELTQINPNAAAGAGSIPLSLPPGATIVTDAYGRMFRVDQQTNASSPVGVPLDSPLAAPTRRGPVQSTAVPAFPRPGEVAITEGQAKSVSDRVSQTLEQANASPQAIDALSRARHILDTGDLSTGENFKHFTTLKNVFAGWGFDVGTDANSLVKNLARYQAARATAAGLGGTDAARELAEKGSPNTKIDATALKGVVTQSLATELALQNYAKIQTGITDPQQLARNETEFRSVPNLIAVYEYGLMRTPEEAAEFRKHHGLSKAEIAASLEKLRKLGAL